MRKTGLEDKIVLPVCNVANGPAKHAFVRRAIFLAKGAFVIESAFLEGHGAIELQVVRHPAVEMIVAAGIGGDACQTCRGKIGLAPAHARRITCRSARFVVNDPVIKGRLGLTEIGAWKVISLLRQIVVGRIDPRSDPLAMSAPTATHTKSS